MNSTSTGEETFEFSINLDWKEDCEDTKVDPSHKQIRQSHGFKYLRDKALLDGIKCFGCVKFYGSAVWNVIQMISISNICGKHDIFQLQPAFHEGALVRFSRMRQDWFKAVFN